mmetsp:Transcript_15962/g.48750  ORF Transcript_15962/g.48750 Transcript_15962/m.48750 type:complete len:202 (-) Transcript_15962:784-1389(-)
MRSSGGHELLAEAASARTRVPTSLQARPACPPLGPAPGPRIMHPPRGAQLTCCRMSCVLRATRAESSVGKPTASSKELVCRLCVPPRVAASASIVVRTTLLSGSCSVRDHPDVWQWVRRRRDLGLVGWNRAWTSSAQSWRAARSLATSAKKSMPMPKKKDRRGATASGGTPRSCAARRYSSPSASVKASSRAGSAPASCMW